DSDSIYSSNIFIKIDEDKKSVLSNLNSDLITSNDKISNQDENLTESIKKESNINNKSHIFNENQADKICYVDQHNNIDCTKNYEKIYNTTELIEKLILNCNNIQSNDFKNNSHTKQTVNYDTYNYFSTIEQCDKNNFINNESNHFYNINIQHTDQNTNLKFFDEKVDLSKFDFSTFKDPLNCKNNTQNSCIQSLDEKNVLNEIDFGTFNDLSNFINNIQKNQNILETSQSLDQLFLTGNYENSNTEETIYMPEFCGLPIDVKQSLLQNTKIFSDNYPQNILTDDFNGFQEDNINIINQFDANQTLFEDSSHLFLYDKEIENNNLLHNTLDSKLFDEIIYRNEHESRLDMHKTISNEIYKTQIPVEYQPENYIHECGYQEAQKILDNESNIEKNFITSRIGKEIMQNSQSDFPDHKPFAKDAANLDIIGKKQVKGKKRGRKPKNKPTQDDNPELNGFNKKENVHSKNDEENISIIDQKNIDNASILKNSADTPFDKVTSEYKYQNFNPHASLLHPIHFDQNLPYDFYNYRTNSSIHLGLPYNIPPFYPMNYHIYNQNRSHNIESSNLPVELINNSQIKFIYENVNNSVNNQYHQYYGQNEIKNTSTYKHLDFFPDNMNLRSFYHSTDKISNISNLGKSDSHNLDKNFCNNKIIDGHSFITDTVISSHSTDPNYQFIPDQTQIIDNLDASASQNTFFESFDNTKDNICKKIEKQNIENNDLKSYNKQTSKNKNQKALKKTYEKSKKKSKISATKKKVIIQTNQIKRIPRKYNKTLKNTKKQRDKLNVNIYKISSEENTGHDGNEDTFVIPQTKHDYDLLRYNLDSNLNRNNIQENISHINNFSKFDFDNRSINGNDVVPKTLFTDDKAHETNFSSPFPSYNSKMQHIFTNNTLNSYIYDPVDGVYDKIYANPDKYDEIKDDIQYKQDSI
ncbi:hypothetical protein EDEG_00130, partial [Edhazardia aedis USNM 41457]